MVDFTKKYVRVHVADLYVAYPRFYKPSSHSKVNNVSIRINCGMMLVKCPPLLAPRSTASSVIIHYAIAMKRHASQPITAFFQRKQTRRISIESISSDSDRDIDASCDDSHLNELNSPADLKSDQKVQSVASRPVIPRHGSSHPLNREDVTATLQLRELDGGATTRSVIGGFQRSRRRRKQLLVRWALTHFQRLPVALHLAPDWEQQAGTLTSEAFYVSCLEFDVQGVLLVAGASNGVIALYDFDDAFYHSLNVGQRALRKEAKNESEKEKEEEGDEEMRTDKMLYPVRVMKGVYTGAVVG